MVLASFLAQASDGIQFDTTVNVSNLILVGTMLVGGIVSHVKLHMAHIALAARVKVLERHEEKSDERWDRFATQITEVATTVKMIHSACPACQSRFRSSGKQMEGSP